MKSKQNAQPTSKSGNSTKPLVSRHFTIADAKAVVDAWGSLEGGRRYSAKDIERWLINDMKPAIDMLRKKINGH